MSTLLSGWDLSAKEWIGIIGSIIFYGRFYLQWFISERRKRSVVPIGFWYMSACGSLILFGYGVYTQSALGTLSHCFNIVIYARNLIHVWRGKGTLSQRRSWFIHGLAFCVVIVALGLLALTWRQFFEASQSEDKDDAFWAWIWLGIGVVGQGLFACRFIIQWITTEKRKESVIPVSFWYLSVAASTLMGLSFVQSQQWVYALGIASTMPIYLRNLWIIHRGEQHHSESA